MIPSVLPFLPAEKMRVIAITFIQEAQQQNNAYGVPTEPGA